MAKKPEFFQSRNVTPASNPSVFKSTPARNTPVPRSEPGKRVITYEMIAKRAYEIHISGQGGSQDENWFRAERELRGL